MLPKIFIAHGSSDRDWARKFATALRDSGVTIWFDEFNIQFGESISDAVQAGLKQSDIVVLLVDEGSLGKPNFFFEMGAALGLNKRIVPVVSENLEQAKLPLSIQRKKYLLRKSPVETAKELVAGLEMLRGEAA